VDIGSGMQSAVPFKRTSGQPPWLIGTHWDCVLGLAQCNLECSLQDVHTELAEVRSQHDQEMQAHAEMVQQLLAPAGTAIIALW